MTAESLVTVVSVRGINPRLAPPTFVYIGRRAGNWPQSPLANPFKLDNESQRAEVIERYRRYLWQKINDDDSAISIALARLADTVQRGEAVQLGCWCGPGKACHGDVVKSAVIWWIANKSEVAA